MISLNGNVVLRGRISMPFRGCWVARLESDNRSVLAGVATIKDTMGSSFGGTVLRSATVGSRCYTRIVGGSAGLRKNQDPQHFQQTTVGQVFKAILSEADETADRFIFPTSTLKTLPFWSTVEGTGGVNLQVLTEKNDLLWRVRPAGAVWIGPEGESLRAPLQANVIDADPSGDCYLVSPEGLWLHPGMEQSFGKVARVEYLLGEKLRAKVWVNAD
jgi:hypothetical protein